MNLAAYAGRRRGAALADEPLMVDIRADVSPAVLSRIRSLGGTVINSVPKYRAIRARLPIAAVEKLAALDAVRSIRPAEVAFTRDRPARLPTDDRPGTLESVVTWAVDTSEGDVAHRANVARSTHGVDGTGIGIGVISDGVATLANQQATGDVPSRVTVLHEQQGGAIAYRCGGMSVGSEGTAILEIVHDLAPGAELFFATGVNGSAQMAKNIEDLCAAGAGIIVDDIGYSGMSVFQDDIIAQAVSAAVANGCYYFSSAGNGGNLNDGTAGVWEGDFAAGSTLTVNGVAVGTAHDFGGGVIRNQITRNTTSSIYLQWADPEGGSANDYDLFLIDASDNVLGSSTSTQDGTQDPFERITASCSHDLKGNRLIIVKTTGAEDRYLRLQYARAGLQIATAGRYIRASRFGGRDRRGRCRCHGRRRRRRCLQRHGVGRDVQLRRSPADLLRARRHADHGGELLVHRRACVAETGSDRRELCFDLDPQFLDVLRHLRRGAARGGDRGPDAGGGRRPRQCHTIGASHGDDRSGARYRGNRCRPRLRRRHRDGARRGGCGGCGGGEPQPDADGVGNAGRPDDDTRRRLRDGRRGERVLRAGSRTVDLPGAVEQTPIG